MGDGLAGKRGVLFAVGALAVLLLLTSLVGSSGGATAPPGPTDLSIAKTDSPDPVFTGGALTYSIQVTNAGPGTATDVVVTDNLPRGVTYISAEPVQGTCTISTNKRRVTCKLGTIAVSTPPIYVPGGPPYEPAGSTITIRVLAPSKPGTITNTATVIADQRDTRRNNNTATERTRVVEAPAATCRGRAANVVGSSAEDLLFGTPGNDVIVARASSDRIFSLGGRDLICAGTGSDVVRSGRGGDHVIAGRGRDRLIGRGGRDRLRGNAGRDQILGGRGADLLAGGRGRDRCFGGPGDDRFRSC
jgi:uncharacterized repeat protein (TIGR01451 family)